MVPRYKLLTKEYRDLLNKSHCFLADNKTPQGFINAMVVATEDARLKAMQKPDLELLEKLDSDHKIWCAEVHAYYKYPSEYGIGGYMSGQEILTALAAYQISKHPEWIAEFIGNKLFLSEPLEPLRLFIKEEHMHKIEGIIKKRSKKL